MRAHSRSFVLHMFPFLHLLYSWANNCAADSNTNGVDKKLRSDAPQPYAKLRAKGIIHTPSDAIGLPSKFQPLLPPINGKANEMVSYLLPDNVTGVVSRYAFSCSIC